MLVNNDKPHPEEMWESFVEKYEPSGDLVKSSDRTIQACEDAGLPGELLDFMKRLVLGIMVVASSSW